MNILNILAAVLVLGVLGLIFGAVLAIAGRVFYVPKDTRYDEISAILPGANCGGCGYAGCSAYADAIVSGNAEVDCCPASSAQVKAEIAKIMGVEVQERERVTALVRCSGGKNAKTKYEYYGLKDCAAASNLAGGPLECKYGCLGMGTCVNVCAFDAIRINDNGVAQVDHEKCTGCLKCLDACPRNIITAVPYEAYVSVACSSHEKGAVLRNICDIGCIGCKICVKTCQHSAIDVEDNLASIDYTKCIGCGECAEKCPRHLIKFIDPDKKPVIEESEEVLQQEV